ncbi:hypothetical protein AB4254_12170 [Vibrio breoganii]
MNKLDAITSDFNESLGNSYPITKNSKIYQKAVLGLLISSITTGAFAGIPTDYDTVQLSQSVVSSQTANIAPNASHISSSANLTALKDADLIITESSKAQYSQPGIQSGLEVPNPDKLYEITNDNYDRIIDERISGVYVHPLLEGEIITVIFDQDSREDVFSLIKDQLHNAGINDHHGFASEYRSVKSNAFVQSDIMGNKLSSVQVQLPHDKHPDPNVIVMRPGANDSNFITLGTLIHEAGHSIDYQQISVWDNTFNKFEAHVKAEIHTNVIERQFMHAWAEKHNAQEAYSEYIQLNNLLGQYVTSIEGSNDPHLFHPVAASTDYLIQNHSEKVAAFEPSQMIKVAEAITEHALSKDFTSGYALSQSAQAKINYEKGVEFYTNFGDNPQAEELFITKIENALSDDTLSERAISKLNDAREIISVWIDLDVKHSSEAEFTKNFVNYKIDKEIGNSGIYLTDINTKHHIANIDLSEYVQEAMNLTTIKDALTAEVTSDHIHTLSEFEPTIASQQFTKNMDINDPEPIVASQQFAKNTDISPTPQAKESNTIPRQIKAPSFDL